MEKKGLRKLQLTRETLRNLSTDELSRVVGGTLGTDDGDCALTVLPCNMDYLPSAAGCGFPSEGCLSIPGHCTNYSGVCGSGWMNTCSPSGCMQC
jgi:hypothetical protein